VALPATLLLGIPVCHTVVFYLGIQLIVMVIDTTADNAHAATARYKLYWSQLAHL